jgi:NAD(P)-dependent dehydrogenase (short-subunit alcohol dehydrogenase family)
MGVAATIVEAGGNVVIAGRSPETLQPAANGIEDAVGKGAIKCPSPDVTKEAQAQESAEVAAAWTGRLHGVVHCVDGTRTLRPITQVDSEGWRETVDLNLNGTMYPLKHAAGHMVRGGGGSFVGSSDYSSLVAPMFGEDALRAIVN